MKLFWAVTTIAAIVLLGVIFESGRNQSGRADKAGSAAPDGRTGLVHPKVASVMSRGGTKYDFVPGGILSVAQFRQSFRGDAALAAQFPDFNFSRAHFEGLNKETCAFVAYRMAAKFGWTRHCIMLRRNEEVLTDGHYLLRARCGNLISVTPEIPLLPQTVQDEIDTGEILPTPAAYGAAAVPALSDVPGAESPPSPVESPVEGPSPFPVSPGPIAGSGPFPIAPSPVAGPLPPGGFPPPCVNCGPTGGTIPVSLPDGDKYIGLVSGMVLILAGVYYVSARKQRR
jgi:hypothetical protein